MHLSRYVSVPALSSSSWLVAPAASLKSTCWALCIGLFAQKLCSTWSHCELACSLARCRARVRPLAPFFLSRRGASTERVMVQVQNALATGSGTARVGDRTVRGLGQPLHRRQPTIRAPAAIVKFLVTDPCRLERLDSVQPTQRQRGRKGGREEGRKEKAVHPDARVPTPPSPPLAHD
ncbi:hypothetical protein LZ30DRAFT_40390 [Colletotrichum cereale]|nr:hypothetical protein LZ30DRAFT_40390 [Colletotrichum cereale]